MQCKIFAALVLSFLSLAVSAAPVPVLADAHLLVRDIEPVALVGMDDVARSVDDEAGAEQTQPEPRACRMIACL
ncbi:hypothetical protein FB45DRAFT_243938 [Roridomyces roridus]|uniref:Uncharacterized protein n=1 Tax=Roridomyces roridus TaxID=1738132 RepID=A0AAD7BAV1_9AGAR|nr:hypothetical protein FB45DRAFT_243938 [Roridomyces roridus]